MKQTIITLLSFFLVFIACSSKEKMLADENIRIQSAEYNHWSEAPPVQSDVRERGTDLRLTVENWPMDAEPKYVVYRKVKSYIPEIRETTENGVLIFARIIRTSAVMDETSEQVEESDRLVFTNANGKTRYVEISEWSRMSSD